MKSLTILFVLSLVLVAGLAQAQDTTPTASPLAASPYVAPTQATANVTAPVVTPASGPKLTGAAFVTIAATDHQPVLALAMVQGMYGTPRMGIGLAVGGSNPMNMGAPLSIDGEGYAVGELSVGHLVRGTPPPFYVSLYLGAGYNALSRSGSLRSFVVTRFHLAGPISLYVGGALNGDLVTGQASGNVHVGPVLSSGSWSFFLWGGCGFPGNATQGGGIVALGF